MKNIKNMKYVWISAYILVVALFFAAGFGAGRVSGRNGMRRELAAQSTAAPETAVNASVTAETPEPEFVLILEDSVLAVYEVENGTRARLTECKISESVFPADDIAALKKGMSFSDRNEAMAMFEDFAS